MLRREGWATDEDLEIRGLGETLGADETSDSGWSEIKDWTDPRGFQNMWGREGSVQETEEEGLGRWEKEVEMCPWKPRWKGVQEESSGHFSVPLKTEVWGKAPKVPIGLGQEDWD